MTPQEITARARNGLRSRPTGETLEMASSRLIEEFRRDGVEITEICVFSESHIEVTFGKGWPPTIH